MRGLKSMWERVEEYEGGLKSMGERVKEHGGEG